MRTKWGRYGVEKSMIWNAISPVFSLSCMYAEGTVTLVRMIGSETGSTALMMVETRASASRVNAASVSKKRKQPDTTTSTPSSTSTARPTKRSRKHKSKNKNKNKNKDQDKIRSFRLLDLPVELVQTVLSHIDNPLTYLTLYTLNSRIQDIAKDPQTRHMFAKTWFASHCNDDKAHAPKLYEYIARYLRRHCKTDTCQTKNTSERFDVVFQKDRKAQDDMHNAMMINEARYIMVWEMGTDLEDDDDDEDPTSMLPKCTLPEPFTWIWHLMDEVKYLLPDEMKKTKWLERYRERLVEVTEVPEGKPWTVHNAVLDVEDVVLAFYMYLEYRKYGALIKANRTMKQHQDRGSLYAWRAMRDKAAVLATGGPGQAGPGLYPYGPGLGF
ncbi:hypothetical protein BJ508DRAFT_326893 [Ascobolus immersus RN42]|uniref:F-box domain-containing protein n=1 Tax=Ascobolus immersus RN42 TaxID=1160509 RepID=A0A3N4I5R6_ASCIM|nr:hypothetical protein BJ508DRAFT_326893 [Ascobolus immersus RN42]